MMYFSSLIAVVYSYRFLHIFCEVYKPKAETSDKIIVIVIFTPHQKAVQL